MKNLIVDLGNTRAKLAVYDGLHILTDVVAVEHSKMLESALDLCRQWGVTRGMYSSVARPGVGESFAEAMGEHGVTMLKLCAESRLPFKLEYPTLGADRIAAIVAGLREFPDRELLIVDAGTAITYEYITADGKYLGGNISAGLQMRFKALHAYTGLLPEVKPDDYDGEIGQTTNGAIAAGVLDGFKMEVEGFARRFLNEARKNKTKKTIILTGGDYKRLVLKVKSCIFARPNLVMDGVAAACELNFGTQIG